MGLLDANQESTDTALRVMASRPLEPETPVAKHSAWSVIPRGLMAAGLEFSGNAGDVSVAAQRKAAVPIFASGDPLRDIASAESFVEHAGVLDADESKDAFRNEVSAAIYGAARDLRPDPVTAGAAENVVFALTKGLSKAVGAGVLLGPVGGAVTFGASEGMTTAEELAEQGVDKSTRTKAGAVVGVVNAAGMALPVAGKTLTQTAALVAVGGPVSFVAQQQAVRSILENADYADIAKQYDPLDPTGLALSFMLPAGFATWAKFGAIKAAMQPKSKPGKSGDEPTEPAPISRDASRPTQEQMDAAMVHHITALADARPARESMELLRAWDEVHSNPIGPPDDPLVRLTPETIGEVLVERGTARLDTDGVTIRTGREGLVKIIVRHGPDSGDANPVTREDIANLPITMRQYEPTLSLGRNGRKEAVWVVDRPVGGPLVIVVKEATRDSRNRLITMYADEANTARPRSEKRKGPDPESSAPSRASQTAGDTAQDTFYRDPESQEKSLNPNIAQQPDAAKVGAGETAASAVTDPYIASMLNRVESLSESNPDMPVAVREDGSFARLADELEALRREVREGTDTELGADDAPLLQVAAECFLSIGAAA